jgi:hypothetical protein
MRSCQYDSCLYQIQQVSISSCHDHQGYHSLSYVNGHVCIETTTQTQNLPLFIEKSISICGQLTNMHSDVQVR